MQLAEYHIQELLYSLGETAVARALDGQGRNVVLKYQTAEHPSLDWSVRWQHEFSVLRGLSSEWIIQALALQSVGERAVLVLEDFGTANLAQLIAQGSLTLGERIGIACQLAAALADVHRHDLIHGDIAPKNVLVDGATLRIKLCDFGLASWLKREPRHPEDAYLRGTLEYMPPERSGRTSLEVDYRSDFYSLGVSLYQLFLGRLPFESADPMTLLHQHIASMPRLLHESDAGIPLQLSRIVHKLLAKSPDERYQSSRGLLADLQDSQQQWQAHHRIEPFELARMDVPERFCLSQTLYGREGDTAALLAAFERAVEGKAELLMVSGYSGIGKTALVDQLHKPVVERRAYFVRGKCEQFNRNQPYLAVLAAFEPLMRQLLAEGEDRRAFWQAHLHKALGSAAAAMVTLLPVLGQLTGPVAPLQALPAGEAESRFHIAFARLVRAIADGGRALVLFLDDLQWADLASLKLLAYLMGEHPAARLLLIGAYRDNEVDAGHALHATLAQVPMTRLALANLAPRHVAEMVADTLRCDAGTAAPLAALCFQKTQGNPFFLGQFLGVLVEHGEVIYDRSLSAWRWNIEQVRQRNMTDNVVDLMLGRLRELAPSTQVLLSLSAHLGNLFSMAQLMAATGQQAPLIAGMLWPALKAGLVLPLDQDYKFDGSPATLAQAHYRFLHDRVQQAARSLTAEADRPALQLRIGRLLLAHTPAAQLDAQLFGILEQYNSALALVTDGAERAQLLDLNIRAGRIAKASSAYPAAVSVLRAGRSMLPASAWQSDPERALLLYRELSEAEYLAGHFAQAEALYAVALAEASDPLARVTMQLVQVDQLHIQGRFADALPVLIAALAQLGADFPADDAAAGALFPAAFGAAAGLLAERSEGEHLAAAELTDERQLLTMRLYFALAYATYQTGRFGQFVLGACRMLDTTLQHGLCDLSSVAHVQFVTAMSVAGKPYAQCYRQGRLALAMAEQRTDRYFRLTIYQYFAAFYQHWCEPLEAGFPYLDKGVEYGREGINPMSAGFCALLGAANKLVKGLELELLTQDCEEGMLFLERSRQPNTAGMLRQGVLLPALALRGVQALAPFEGDPDAPSIHLALYSAAMLRHGYLMEERSLWEHSAARLAVVGMCLPDSPAMVDATFYTAMGLLEFEPDGVQRASDYRDTFARWALDCPANFEHKARLLTARMAELAGDGASAMGAYSAAIDAAAQSGFRVCEALANELYARYWLRAGQKQLAANFIREAWFLYRRWGALVKCDWLEAHWPQVQFNLGERSQSGPRSSGADYGKLDMQSLLKANQLMAQEIQLDSLLQKMIGVLLENAGAEQGAIVIEDDGLLVLEAMGQMNSAGQVDCQRMRLTMVQACERAEPLVPEALLAHVRDTRGTLLLNHPVADPRFSYDAYLLRRQPQSVLCLPVLTQGKLLAIVYLENNLMANAFTARHQKTLELLTSQAAISLVHARLVERLEDKVSQRTAELRAMAMKDGLTGIANRRSFDERLHEEWRRAVRSGQPLSLLMIDIDHFKRYNDHYGHLEGDHCIKQVAALLQDVASRATDMVARYGGEEFAVLMSGAGADAAGILAQRCLAGVRALQMAHADAPGGAVSISIGLATLQPTRDVAPALLIDQADKALYVAKRAGRDRCCQFE